MTPNTQKIIEDKVKEFDDLFKLVGVRSISNERRNDFLETVKKFLFSSLQEVHRSAYLQALEEVEREFKNKKYNIDPSLGEFLSKKGIFDIIKSKKEKI